MSKDALPAVPRVDLYDEFLKGFAATTVRAYIGDLKRFGEYLKVDPPAAAVDRYLECGHGRANELALAWKNAMLAAGLSSATIARRLAALRSIVKLARKLGRVTWAVEVDDPAAEPRRDVRGPDESDQRRLWRYLAQLGETPKARRDRAVIALLFDLGLRRAEVAGLDLADVDMYRRALQVLRKGKREKAPVEVEPETLNELRGWILERGSEPGPLFTRLDNAAGEGERISGGAIAVLVAQAGERAGLRLPKLRPHGLRHAAITGLWEAGLSGRDVCAFSGHKREETAARYDDTRRAAAEKGRKLLVKRRGAKAR